MFPAEPNSYLTSETTRLVCNSKAIRHLSIYTMSAQLFVGRLSKSTRQRDIEDTFSYYGPMTRCELKFGTGMAYAFVDYGDKRDAEDAIRHENGREICGQSIVVEWARGPKRGYEDDECYRCGYRGHFARDCRDRGGGRGGFRSQGYPSRRRSRSRDRARSRSRSRDRARSRSRDRGRNRHSRSRSRSRSRTRSRDRHARRSPSRSRSRSPQKDNRSPSPVNSNGRDRDRSHDRDQSGDRRRSQDRTRSYDRERSNERSSNRHSHSCSPDRTNGHDKSPF